MKYALLGDIHANLEALAAVLEKAQQLDVDEYLCLGDLVGYNANPCECIDTVKSLKPLAILRGNHDEYASSDDELVGFNPQAAQAVEWTRGHLSEELKEWLAARPLEEVLNPRVSLVHATLDMPGKWGYIFDKWSADASFNYQRTQICFFGHTHVPTAFTKFNQVTAEKYSLVKFLPAHKYLINVGSVGQPRDGDPRAAFVVYDDEERTAELHRVEYDLRTCQAKIRKAGLPERCAARLAIGR